MPLDDDPLREMRVRQLARIGGLTWAEEMADREAIVKMCDGIILKALFGEVGDAA